MAPKKRDPEDEPDLPDDDGRDEEDDDNDDDDEDYDDEEDDESQDQWPEDSTSSGDRKSSPSAFDLNAGQGVDDMDKIESMSWYEYVVPCLQRIAEYDEQEDGNFVDFIVEQTRVALALREEMDEAPPEFHSHPIYKQVCDIGIMATSYHLVSHFMTISTMEFHRLTELYLELGRERGLNLSNLKANLLKALGVLADSAKTVLKIESEIKKSEGPADPWEFN